MRLRCTWPQVQVVDTPKQMCAMVTTCFVSGKEELSGIVIYARFNGIYTPGIIHTHAFSGCFFFWIPNIGWMTTTHSSHLTHPGPADWR